MLEMFLILINAFNAMAVQMALGLTIFFLQTKSTPNPLEMWLTGLAPPSKF